MLISELPIKIAFKPLNTPSPHAMQVPIKSNLFPPSARSLKTSNPNNSTQHKPLQYRQRYPFLFPRHALPYYPQIGPAAGTRTAAAAVAAADNTCLLAVGIPAADTVHILAVAGRMDPVAAGLRSSLAVYLVQRRRSRLDLPRRRVSTGFACRGVRVLDRLEVCRWCWPCWEMFW